MLKQVFFYTTYTYIESGLEIPNLILTCSILAFYKEKVFIISVEIFKNFALLLRNFQSVI